MNPILSTGTVAAQRTHMSSTHHGQSAEGRGSHGISHIDFQSTDHHPSSTGSRGIGNALSTDAGSNDDIDKYNFF